MIPVLIDSHSHLAVRALFLRLLGLVYGIAFLSLWVQIDGLIGSSGILPAVEFFPAVEDRLGAEAWVRLPSILWLDQSDSTIQLMCGSGVALAILLCVGYAPGLALAGLWVLYLSLVVAGRDFLSFQWDALLLECGFLAILLAPHRLRRHWIWPGKPSIIALWLLRILLFRVMFSSGVVKLSSGDPTWSSLRALDYHYLTQPLPTWASWYAHQLPLWIQTFSVGAMFAIELLVPFAILGPRKVRLIGALLLVVLQVLIGATGNYGFFNLLVIALCVTLLDDDHLALVGRFRLSQPPATASGRAPTWLTAVIAILVLALSGIQMAHAFRWRASWPRFLTRTHEALMPFRLVNGYGLFAVMTTKRREIVVEGSADGQSWKAYEFPWKPGDPEAPPAFVQPHMPRLDWQMWFAALRTYDTTPWFMPFLGRLLQGSSPVVSLLQSNPFPDAPPAFIRAVFYEYDFEYKSGSLIPKIWWKRRLLGLYSPPVSVR